jgi:hypothetical protein
MVTQVDEKKTVQHDVDKADVLLLKYHGGCL